MLKLDRMIAQIRKLNIVENDFIFIKVPKHTSTADIRQLVDCIVPISESKKCHFLIDETIQSISKVSEKDMKKYGWVRRK